MIRITGELAPNTKEDVPMFADPQTVTVNSVAKTLPAISRGENQSIYRASDEAWTLRISKNIANQRERLLVEVVQLKDAVTAQALGLAQQDITSKVQLIIDHPRSNVGFSDTELKNQVQALCDWLSASSYAATLKVLGQET